MISSFKPGMRHDVSVGQFKMRLLTRTVKAMELHARNRARLMSRAVKTQLELKLIDWDMATDKRMLREMAHNYGVHKLLIPYAIEMAQKFITTKA